MIKANELRIGNYLHNPVQNINFKIDARVIISIESEEKRSEIYDKYSYKPIPLTEEMLLKCNFLSKGFTNEFENIKEYILSNEISVDYFTGTKDFDILYKGVALNYYDEKEIYVHELQNVFYFLTGKELEIKL